MNQPTKQKEKRIKKNEQDLSDLWDYQVYQLHIRNFEKIMFRKFHLMEDMNLQAQKAQ